MKIDRNLLESSKFIRMEYESLMSKFNHYEKQALDLKNFFDKKIEELTDMNKQKVSKIKSKGDLEVVTKDIMTIIEEMEQETEKITRSVEAVNKKIESLKRDEEILYEKIKEKYPDLSDESIQEQVWDFLKTSS
jgi:chromosome segregation ATPase